MMIKTEVFGFASMGGAPSMDRKDFASDIVEYDGTEFGLGLW